MSRKASPKQLHKLTGEKSLLQETYERVKDLVPKENIYVALVRSILEDSQKQLPKVPKDNFIIEPSVKNTAPAIGLVAATIFRVNPKAIISTIASDHTIQKVNNFQTALKACTRFLEKNPDYFLTLGIKPTRPDTGFGYIKSGKKISKTAFYQVEKFVEKPDLQTAQKYLKAGNYLWNASYFTFSVSSLLKMYQKYAPDIYKVIEKILKLMSRGASQNEVDKAYETMPVEPIDTAIAEKAEKIAVIPADLDWSDVGTWASLYEILTKKSKHHTVSKGNHIGLDDKDCLVYAQDKLLATVGLEDIVIVDTPDVTLVCDINHSQDVKKLLEKIKENGKLNYL